LQALREKYRDGRLVAVFEPRSASSRLAVFQDEYVEALRQADYVVIAQVFERDKGSKYGELLDTDELIRDVAADGRTPAYCLDGADAIVSHLAPQLRAGDTVAVMSNGGFGGIHDKLLAALRDAGGRGAAAER
jgi:UDP-N-acetylmuramate: L-alanyl-gamma-D-glutamyl-meso-diaminopimelate ligase